MKFSLENKVAIVTGGGSGIGRAISLAVAAAGAFVHVLERGADAGAAIARELGDRGCVHRCDVSRGRDVESALAGPGLDRIDLLVNNAGIAHVGTVESTSEADLDRLYAVNVKGVYHCIRAVVPRMKAHGGVILNLASIAGSVGLADRFAYSTTKGAVLAMTYSVARDYLAYGIRCNSISPARVRTPFVDRFVAENYPGRETETLERLAASQPIGRMGRPEEVADLAVFLASDAASFATGTDFPLDGGFIKLNG